jgi:glycosyltransferase involved in cell wall biosynthesis
MYRRFDGAAFGAPIRDFDGEIAACRWSVVIPFFNEEALLADTIASLAAQDMPFELILVDNGSTDRSVAVAAMAAIRHGLRYRLIHEPCRGKVAALATGIAAVTTELVATCDADTWYPPQYLRTAASLLAREGCVATGAYFVRRDASNAAHAQAAARMLRSARLFPGQCHTGGAGQAFVTAALRRAGSFDPARWNYVLEDHEIVERLRREGHMAYSPALWCAPSTRERNRQSTRWSLVERIAYHATAGAGGRGDWFFRQFLGPRLERRRLGSEGLRERPEPGFQHQEVRHAAARPVFG